MTSITLRSDAQEETTTMAKQNKVQQMKAAKDAGNTTTVHGVPVATIVRDGKTMTGLAAIGAYFKVLALAGADTEETLPEMTDEQAGAIVMAIHGDKDKDTDRAQALLDSEPTVHGADSLDVTDLPLPQAKSISAVTGSADDVMIGAKVDAEMAEHFRTFVKAATVVDGMPITTALDLEKRFPIAEILQWPWPNSKPAGTSKKVETDQKTWPYPGFNGPFDYYDNSATTGGKATKHSVQQLVNSQWGSGLVKLRDLGKKVKDKETMGPGDMNVIERLQETLGIPVLPAKDLVEDTTYKLFTENMNTALNRIHSKWCAGVKYLQHKAAIEALSWGEPLQPGSFRVVPVTRDLATLCTLRSPLKVCFIDEHGDPKDLGKMSIGGFLRLKPWKAKLAAEKEGVKVNLAILNATAKKASKAPTALTVAAGRPLATTAIEFYDAILSASSYATVDHSSLIELALDKTRNKPEDVRARIKAIGDLHATLDDVMKRHHVEYDLITETLAAENAAENAQRLQEQKDKVQANNVRKAS